MIVSEAVFLDPLHNEIDYKHCRFKKGKVFLNVQDRESHNQDINRMTLPVVIALLENIGQIEK